MLPPINITQNTNIDMSMDDMVTIKPDNSRSTLANERIISSSQV